MKRPRRFSLSRALQRVRLGVRLSPKKRWPTSSPVLHCQVQIADEPDEDVELLEASRSGSLSLIRSDGLQIPRSSSLPTVTIKLLFGSPFTVLSRFKKSCGALRETAESFGFSEGDLFVGSQMFMHFSAIAVTRHRQMQAKPSFGFAEREREAQEP